MNALVALWSAGAIGMLCRGAKRLRRLAGLGVFALLAGCTTVNVDGASVSTTRHFGILRLDPVGPDQTLVLYLRGFGIVPGRGGLTVGYRRELSVAYPDGSNCRLMILAERGAEERLRELLRELELSGGTQCIISSSGWRVRPQP
jgi:hypothetical protein